MIYECFNCNNSFDDPVNERCPRCHSIDFESKAEVALKNFVYEACRAIGIIWLVKVIPFLKLKQWARIREMANRCMRSSL